MANNIKYRQELESIKKEVKFLRNEMVSLKEVFEDHILTDEEKIMLGKAIKAKKEGKLFTSREVFA